jgi:hypothetical protein
VEGELPVQHSPEATWGCHWRAMDRPSYLSAVIRIGMMGHSTFKPVRAVHQPDSETKPFNIYSLPILLLLLKLSLIFLDFCLIRLLVFLQDSSLLHSVHSSSEAHPAFYTRGTGALFPGIKRQGREANHSPLSSAEVKNARAIPPLPHVSSWCSA